MQKNIVIDAETEEILKEIDKIYGATKCKDILTNYASYIKMKKRGEISFGNYNMIVRDKSEYRSSEQIVEVVYKLLKINNMITTSYKYLKEEDITKGKGNADYKKIKEMTQQLLIIDSQKIDTPLNFMQSEMKEIINKFKEKIFIIIDKNEMRFRTGLRLGDIVSWNIEIERISKEEKSKYIKEFLETNKINIENKNTFIDCLSEEELWKVQEELFYIVLECKCKGIEKLSDEVIKDKLKKKYYKDKEQKKKEPKCAIKELETMIGMKEVKEQIEQIVNFIQVNKKRKKMPALHMCFMGNPGTGKTTVARIVGKIFSEMQILSDKKVFVEAERADLIGKYVGHTAPKTQECLDRAEGGILFIDEAYSISSYIQDEVGGDYGAECIATLIKGMEDKRDKLCVILAGYTKEMERMLQVNPGFESRVQFKINFPDYTEEELYEIFKNMVKDENYKLSNNVKDVLLEYFRIEKKKENFANARCARNLFEKVKFEQASRVAKNKKENINLIKKCDIENVIANTVVEQPEKRRIGFIN